jgi:hypothetical protein
MVRVRNSFSNGRIPVSGRTWNQPPRTKRPSVDCRSFYNDHIWENGVKKPIPENSREKLAEHVPHPGWKLPGIDK